MCDRVLPLFVFLLVSVLSLLPIRNHPKRVQPHLNSNPPPTTNQLSTRRAGLHGLFQPARTELDLSQLPSSARYPTLRVAALIRRAQSCLCYITTSRSRLHTHTHFILLYLLRLCVRFVFFRPPPPNHPPTKHTPPIVPVNRLLPTKIYKRTAMQ